MTFRQYEEPKEEVKSKKDNDLYEMFGDLIQFEEDKLALISAAKAYFCKNGLESYKKFFEFLAKTCCETKLCLTKFLITEKEVVPVLHIPEVNLDFEDEIAPFKTVAKMENEFLDRINAMLTKANEDKNWRVFSYLLKKLDCVDGLCTRALAAVNNKSDVLALIPCEQHSSEK